MPLGGDAPLGTVALRRALGDQLMLPGALAAQEGPVVRDLVLEPDHLMDQSSCPASRRSSRSRSGR